MFSVPVVLIGVQNEEVLSFTNCISSQLSLAELLGTGVGYDAQGWLCTSLIYLFQYENLKPISIRLVLCCLIFQCLKCQRFLGQGLVLCPGFEETSWFPRLFCFSPSCHVFPTQPCTLLRAVNLGPSMGLILLLFLIKHKTVSCSFCIGIQMGLCLGLLECGCTLTYALCSLSASQGLQRE